MVTAIKYDACEDFKDNHVAVVKLNGKYGVVNDMGVEVLKPTFNWININDKNILETFIDDRISYYDQSGKCIFGCNNN